MKQVPSLFLCMALSASCRSALPSVSVDDEEGTLPLLVEQSLGRELRLTTSDRVSAQLTVRNTSRNRVMLKYGAGATTLEVRRMGNLDSLGTTKGTIPFEPADAWASPGYLVSPSPYSVRVTWLAEKYIEPGGVLNFGWRANPLPAGEYMLRVCVELLDRPRRGEGGWQTIHWCAAQETHLLVTAP